MEDNSSSTKNYLHSDLLSRVSSLHMLVEQLLWGYRTGGFRSIRKDSGIEFLEHKDYTIGEDIRDVDWRVSARKEKLLVRKYQAESDLTAVIALDISADMAIGSPPPIEMDWLSKDKFTRSLVLTATLAKFLQDKGERVGLVLMGGQNLKTSTSIDEGEVLDRMETESSKDSLMNADEVNSSPQIFVPLTWLPPKSSQRHFVEIMTKLATSRPTGEALLGRHLEYITQKIPSRSILYVISDFMEEPETWKDAIPMLRFKKTDIRFVHLHSYREFTMQVNKPLQFLSNEDTSPLHLDPDDIRQPFLNIVQNYLRELQDIINPSKVTYIPDAIENPIERAFLSMILNRHTNPLDIILMAKNADVENINKGDR